MQRILSYFVSIVVMLCLTCCADTHFISDSAYRRQVADDFEQRKNDLADTEFLSVFDENLSVYEREALEFLYAYMPLADIADYSGDFHLANVRMSRQAADEMPWGKTIPEEVFRHFVLPVRINNEQLDSARMVFYEELRDRVQQLSMYDAILEVNHWCHQKAIYTPSDSRTSSPLATVRTAYGRCGEESTLLVAALRSVGIPARQVYTPRWAHTDDNHAWVEAWADGQWYFLGACEPEPVLNLGWFNSPASRGMLMHTKVFGRYNGTEEIMKVTPTYTEINVIENYAPVASAEVTVVDKQGLKVEDALVEFKLYNYGEFYTVASKRSNAEGMCSLTAGKGDMLVWASKDGNYGFSKVSFGKDEAITVILDKTLEDVYAVDIDIIPPVEGANLPDVTAEQRSANDCRLADEDSIRNAYVSTFMTDRQAREYARANGMDENVIAEILVASRGNHKALCRFLSELDPEMRADGIDLLKQISAKDLRDVTLEVLRDHIIKCDMADRLTFSRYVRNPRISNEYLTPFRSFFTHVISEELAQTFKDDPFKLVTWVADNIIIDNDCNLGAPAISPSGVWHARMADARSRDIFFVALARSLGIPSRVDEVTDKVQLMIDGTPSDVKFDATEQIASPQGSLVASYVPTLVLDDPKYYYHFTISQLTSQGDMQLLSYDEDGTAWSNLLKNSTSLDAGTYVMVSGTRLANGGVLAHLECVKVEPDMASNTELIMRQVEHQVQVIGNFNSESLFTNIDSGDKQSLLQACGRGYFVVGILGVDQEPTNHALRDIAAVKVGLEEWGRPMVLLFTDRAQADKFKADLLPALPSTIIYGIDTDGIADQIAEAMKLKNSTSLPIFIIADTFNRVVFVSQGYTIGLGNQLMDTVKGL